MCVADKSQGLGTVLSGVQGTLTGGGGAAQGVRAFIGWMAGPPRAAQAGDEDEDDGFATPDEDEGEGDDHGAKAGGGKGGAKSEGGAGGGGSSASNASCSIGGDGEGGDGGEALAAVTRAPEAVEGRAAAAPPQEVEMGAMRPPPKLERFHSAEG